VGEFARPTRCAKGKVFGLDQGDAQSARCGVQGNAGAGHSTADDHDIDGVVEHMLPVALTAAAIEVTGGHASRFPRWRCQTVAVVDTSHLTQWGTPRHPIDLRGRVSDFLHSHVGVASAWPTLPFAAVPASRIDHADRESLAQIVGAAYVDAGDDARIGATGGASYLDWVRHRRGEVSDVPDVVVRPADAAQVVEVLRWAEQRGIAVVPLGGGTSVVGGLRADRPRVVLRLDRLGGLIAMDEVSALATVGPALTGPRLEALLEARDFTLGHLPQSWMRASMGGYVATRSAGQASSGYGRIDDMVEAITVATPRGVIEVGRAPSSAAGPDLRALFVGSEGAFGVITSLTLRVRRRPTTRRYEAVLFPSFAAGVDAFRSAAQGLATADVMRLSDEAETRTSLAMSGPQGLAAGALARYLNARSIDVDSAALAILGWEGTDRAFVRDRRAATLRAMKPFGAVSLGQRVGQSWRRGRFDGPHLRDALMDQGYLVETLETAAHWSGYLNLHTDVTATIRAAMPARPGPYVMSHLSHVYETGASMYTTVIAVADQADPEVQWQRAKNAAMGALVDHGATITHHHAMGRDHANWLADEVGPLGVDVLRSIKAYLDPSTVLNPGVLFAEEPH